VPRSRLQNALGDPAGRVLGRGPNTDPYGRYERVRTEGDLVHSRLGIYLSASHELVNSVLRDSRFGVQTSRGQRPGTSGRWPAARSTAPCTRSTTRSCRWTRRGTLGCAAWSRPGSQPRALRDRTERIEAIVHRFLEDLAGRDRFDLIGDFAVRVPIQVICDLLGVPDAEYPRFIRWGAIVALALDSVWTLGDYRQLRVALTEMSAFFTDLVEYRKQHPGDDVVSELVATGAPLAVDDLLATVELLLVAGFETTVNLIGNGVLALLRDNEARAWLLANPERADDLVEEVLRHDPPVQYTMRLSHEPVNLAGTVLPTDTPVVLLLAGANRDPNVFADPGRFDPTRPNNREHLAFSAGIHYCLGAGLARIEAAVGAAGVVRALPRTCGWRARSSGAGHATSGACDNCRCAARRCGHCSVRRFGQIQPHDARLKIDRTCAGLAVVDLGDGDPLLALVYVLAGGPEQGVQLDTDQLHTGLRLPLLGLAALAVPPPAPPHLSTVPPVRPSANGQTTAPPGQCTPRMARWTTGARKYSTTPSPTVSPPTMPKWATSVDGLNTGTICALRPCAAASVTGPPAWKGHSGLLYPVGPPTNHAWLHSVEPQWNRSRGVTLRCGNAPAPGGDSQPGSSPGCHISPVRRAIGVVR